MDNLKFSICLPAYNGDSVIAETIQSILSQDFNNFELIIVDDNSKDNTESVVKSFKDKRIKYYKNQTNLGFQKNIRVARKKAIGDIIYLMAQDDILAKGALSNTYKAFKISEDIGAVTRAYYWFDKEINTPVRAKDLLNPDKDEIVTIKDNYQRVITVFKTLDQMSGLAYRAKYMDLDFHDDIFPSHVYPFASIFKRHPIVFLKYYNVAVRIATSQSRSPIYDRSPIQSWVDMFNNVFFEPEFKKIKERCIKDFVAVNYVGLLQIRNYSKYQYLWREIYLLLKYRWQNFFKIPFWFFSLGCIVMPPFLLIPMVDWYKNNVNTKLLKHIKFEYDLG